ncbi:hypothetical protein E2C01_084991 [Portunus trituberculatus]|uniref:Uncharacterized protein n=1 Tax=Portunus trituberculatus TaxID=210409 RepID=A0A5B7JCC9_PORTR|nr:hypothetical protein [Portunus trituberculatus]
MEEERANTLTNKSIATPRSPGTCDPRAGVSPCPFISADDVITANL